MIIGAHESVSGGIFNAVYRAMEDKCEALQVFVKSPSRWTGAKLTKEEIDKFKNVASSFGVKNITAHSAYLINLASPKTDVWDKSIDLLVDEMGRCDALDIPYYVMHPGSPLDSGRESGIDKVITAINKLHDNNSINCMLLLEATAGMGTTLGGDLADIKIIIDSVKHPDKIGLCLDSCHMYSAGYDIVENYDTVFDDIHRTFGDKLKIFHLNDSKNPFNSRKDRHELIGKGTIGLSFFERVMKDSRFKNVLGILETPVEENYKEEIATLKFFRDGAVS